MTTKQSPWAGGGGGHGSILHHSIRLRCDARRAFAMFTVTERVQAWLAARAAIEPVEGGKYELFWDPDDPEGDNTAGCKVTAVEPEKLIAFEWRGPKRFDAIMNTADPLTHVVVFFLPCEDPPSCTEVHLVHSGWGRSAEWKAARKHFERVWAEALERLRERCDA